MRFKIALLTVFIFQLGAEPIKVPQEFYSGYGKSPSHAEYYPFITDILFSSISDHIIDQSSEWFDPKNVKIGDIIYLNIWYLEWFEKTVHDAIEHPYLLITCDVGDWLPETRFKRLLYDPKLTAWFCRNIVFSYHPKIFQIPMGQHDRMVNISPYLKTLISRDLPPKTHLLYMNHQTRPHGSRNEIVRIFENESYCFSRNHSSQVYGHIQREFFLDELASSQFVISPWGLETDCVRTWEALALHTIPIVEHSFLDPLFEELPVLFVHEWTEINECLLKEKGEFFKNASWEKAFFDPWKDLILETQRKVKNGDVTFSTLEATLFRENDLDELLSILGENKTIIYRGALSSMHALQLLKKSEFLSKIYFCDPWIDQKTLKTFTTYLKDPQWIENIRKLNLIPFQTFDTVMTHLSSHNYPLFLDFSFYRNSLMRDPTFKNFRHSLRQDLNDLYLSLTEGTLLCGNMAENDYVREVLEKFSEDTNLTIERKGQFWFLYRD